MKAIKEGRKNLKTAEDRKISCDHALAAFVKATTLLKAFYRFNALSNKIPIFTKLEKTMLNSYESTKYSKKPNNLDRKNKGGCWRLNDT